MNPDPTYTFTGVMKYALIGLSLIFLVIITLAVIWNHRVVPIPSDIDLTKVIPGETTVGEFEKILGISRKSHTCVHSAIYRSIITNPATYGRSVEIVGFYRGPNTGYPGRGLIIDHDDSQCIIRKIEVNDYPRLSTSSTNPLERYAAIILAWEFRLFTRQAE